MMERKIWTGSDDIIGYVHEPVPAGKQNRSSLDQKCQPCYLILLL